MRNEQTMNETPGTSSRDALKTPRSAAIAGIIFAVLYGASMVLINISLPHEPAEGFAWLSADVRTVTLALNLIPVRRDCLSLVHWCNP